MSIVEVVAPEVVAPRTNDRQGAAEEAGRWGRRKVVGRSCQRIARRVDRHHVGKLCDGEIPIQKHDTQIARF